MNQTIGPKETKQLLKQVSATKTLAEIIRIKFRAELIEEKNNIIVIRKNPVKEQEEKPENNCKHNWVPVATYNSKDHVHGKNGKKWMNYKCCLCNEFKRKYIK